MENWIENHTQHRGLNKPRLLHLIWVGTSEQPAYLQKHITRWKELMPEWTIRLWTNDDLTPEEIKLEVLERIHEADRGVQKADILRYYVVWKYGGIYVDADIEPIRSLEPILYMSDLVICHDNIIEWQYISNAFFAASAYHPVLERALAMCLHTQLNTNAPHMTTGPSLFGRVVSQTPPVNEKYTLLDIECFYLLDKGITPSRFGRHFYAASWDT